MIDTRAVRVELLRLKGIAASLTESIEHAVSVLDGADGVQVPREGRVTRQMVADVWAESNHLLGVRALFEEAATHPNKGVTFSQVRARSGLDEQQQGNEHARLTRNTIKLFGHRIWPLEAWQGNDEMLYRMGGTVAGWFREINS